jgi:hypothetical protein
MIRQDSQLDFDPARHHYFLNGRRIPGVTEVLTYGGLLDYDFLSREHRAACLARGQAVHRLTQLNDEDRLVESNVPPELAGYLESWRRFRLDYQFRPTLIERRVYNRQFNFAGCLDRTGQIRGGAQVLLDLKTNTAPDAVPIQLSAYGSTLAHPRAWHRWCVQLCGNGRYKVTAFKLCDFQRDFDAFLAMLAAYRRRRNDGNDADTRSARDPIPDIG